MKQPEAPSPAPGFPPDDVVAGLLEAATRAPSMHNTQPWRFRVRPASQEIELHADPSRALRFSDPQGRAVHIACGAALFNLRLAVLMAGRQPVVKLLPDPGPHAPTLLATVRLAGIRHPGETDRELHAAIATRRTNRRPYSNLPVPPGVLGELAAAARLEGGVLHLPGEEETHRLLHLISGAERDLLADPGYRAELARWAGGERDRDGIPAAALGPRDPVRATPVRDFGTPTEDYAWFEDTPQLAVLSTATSTPLGWLRAGQALQRVLLTATIHGIAASPLTQPLETADAWLVRDPASASESPQMILRLGYGLPVPATPRRPIAEVLDEPGVR